MNTIKHLSTSKFIEGGFSTGNYANFNLATHTGDKQTLVLKNRNLLLKFYKLPQMPKFLEQTHSSICLGDNDSGNFADSIITTKKSVVCCVLTADCLPIFLWNKSKTLVGVAHAGWQGILNGVIEEFIAKTQQNPKDLQIKFGTALGIDNFAVGLDFYQNFINKDKDFKSCFASFEDKYKFDIYKAANLILTKLGITDIHSENGNTFTNDNLFSYRRDGEKSGRQAHLIWIES